MQIFNSLLHSLGQMKCAQKKTPTTHNLRFGSIYWEKGKLQAMLIPNFWCPNGSNIFFYTYQLWCRGEITKTRAVPTFWATLESCWGPHDILSTGRGLCLITLPVRVECPHGLTCCRTLSKGSALARSSTLSPVSSLHCSVKSNVSGLTRHLWSFPTCEGEFERFTGQIVARGSLIHWTNTISPLDPNPAKLQQTYSTTKQTTKMTIISKSTELSTDRPKQTGVFSEGVGNYTAFPRVQHN